MVILAAAGANRFKGTTVFQLGFVVGFPVFIDWAVSTYLKGTQICG